MPRKKPTRRSDSPQFDERDLLSPTLLRLVLPEFSVKSSTQRISDRALGLYLEGALSGADLAAVEAAVANDPSLEQHLAEMREDLQSAFQDEAAATSLSIQVPTQPAPASRRVHIGDILLVEPKQPLNKQDVDKALELAGGLVGLLETQRKENKGTAGGTALVSVLDEIKRLVVRPNDRSSSHRYRFSGAGWAIEVFAGSPDRMIVTIRSEADGNPVPGVEVSFASDVGQLATVETGARGEAQLPTPRADATLIVMTEPPLEIGISSRS